ncbi:glycosyltransferase [Erythrobacter sp.]|uniref:glycosyltransferase n=1 Tax=Erythrobacter sp. TaxID=1042 RepID=UPI003C75EC7D
MVGIRGGNLCHPAIAAPAVRYADGRRERAALSHVVEPILAAPPFAAKFDDLRISGDMNGRYDYVVAVPVCNEEAMLPRALSALADAMRSTGRSGAIVVAMNNSSDLSAVVAQEMAEACGIEHLIVELDFAPAIRNAPHARRLALDIAATLAPDGVLFTTDADSHVSRNWIVDRLALADAGIDLVCEDVRLDDVEAAELPERVRLIGEVERGYFRMCERLWSDWTRGQRGRFAHRASGASLAVRTAAYREIGGLPLPECGEDRALCSALLSSGRAVETIDDGGTRTSARLVGRAAGGCGIALAERAQLDDPFCDGTLVPVHVLRALALDPVLSKTARTAASQPMRFSEVQRELSLAQEMLGERA